MLDDIDEEKAAQQLLGYLGAYLEFRTTQEGSVSAAFEKLGKELQDSMEAMERQGKPYLDVLDVLLEDVAVYECACQDYSHLPLPNPPEGPSH